MLLTPPFCSPSLNPNLLQEILLSCYTVIRVRLFAPDFLLDELLSLKERICEFCGIDEEEFTTSFILLCEVVDVIPKSEYERFLSEAKSLLPEHPKDASYFALALKLSISIWSNEKRFKKQSAVKVFSTHELNGLFLFG
ncbi:MAG: hypothetical protein EF812_03555 [Methanosarcinales archaeon]|nr:MAG: hypothetical protein EF812_03555 [Methanosarcinales archaeon]